jgi:hypothetical protein
LTFFFLSFFFLFLLKPKRLRTSAEQSVWVWLTFKKAQEANSSGSYADACKLDDKELKTYQELEHTRSEDDEKLLISLQSKISNDDYHKQLVAVQSETNLRLQQISCDIVHTPITFENAIVRWHDEQRVQQVRSKNGGLQIVATIQYRSSQKLFVFFEGVWQFAVVVKATGFGSQHVVKMDGIQHEVHLCDENHAPALFANAAAFDLAARSYRIQLEDSHGCFYDVWSSEKLRTATQTISLQYSFDRFGIHQKTAKMETDKIKEISSPTEAGGEIDASVALAMQLQQEELDDSIEESSALAMQLQQEEFGGAAFTAPDSMMISDSSDEDSDNCVTWTCRVCGKHNEANKFCGVCGKSIHPDYLPGPLRNSPADKKQLLKEAKNTTEEKSLKKDNSVDVSNILSGLLCESNSITWRNFVLIVGEAASGKTTLLKTFIVRIVQQYKSFLPILIPGRAQSPSANTSSSYTPPPLF